MLSTASLWPPRLAALLLSALAAVSGVYWVLHWRLPVQVARAGVVADSGPAVDVASVARALGAVPGNVASPTLALAAPGADAARFALQGVLGGAQAGTALIAIDGKAAKPYALGAELVEGWSLLRVAGRTAVLGRQGTELELALPPLPQAATGKKTLQPL
ncbi:general secretion pathway protein C [Rhodoferax sp.]|uniref:general secretion pathway protein C n=1 Tax=Rhodoferax sp. TaxID=50421 RepID=UPI0025DAEEC3|nr:general secretion pathway protein C [Rhodoferax sp.]